MIEGIPFTTAKKHNADLRYRDTIFIHIISRNHKHRTKLPVAYKTDLLTWLTVPTYAYYTRQTVLIKTATTLVVNTYGKVE